MNKLYPVYTLKNECHDCYKCVRECYVKAIKIENGHASVMSDKCIACGSCVQACPSKAKRVRNDVERVKNLFIAKKNVIVSLAPTWSGIFDYSPAKMITILKALGFSQVSETALGAQEVSIKTAQMLNSADSGLFISSACPVIVDYLRLYNPDYAKHITPIASPALTHAKLLKEKYGDNISVVFIGPCIAKKNEAEKHPELIDVALTFEELNWWIGEEFIETDKLEINEKEKFIPESSYEGNLYPLEGGMNNTIGQIGVKDNVQLLAVSSIPTLEKTLENFDEKLTTKPIFIEALACDGGCVFGPCSTSDKSGVAIISDVISKTRKRPSVPKLPQVVVEEIYKPQPISDKKVSLEEISEALKKIGKYTDEDELNCGGCGYPTCRDLAKALVLNVAESSMCVSYMRKIAMQKAAAMLRCMPSAMVMVDNKLNIVEANEAFMHMFCGDMYDFFASQPNGLVGASIERIVDFSDIFKYTLKSGKDIHKERYPIKNKLYDISAFIVEKHEIAGAIITDVTKTEMNREKIAQRAHEVISKNISIVQEIACLLGEHMVETELLLDSIANDFDVEKEETGEK